MNEAKEVMKENNFKPTEKVDQQVEHFEEVKKGLPKKAGSRIINKQSSIHYVHSRGELLEEEKNHFEDLRKKIVKTRRTKIFGTMSALYNNYEALKSMVQAGLNAFMVNMAYCSPDLVVSLRKHRDNLEKEFDVKLPITCVLKGTLIRIGTLTQAEIFLKKGQEYRIVLNPKVLGNNLFCAVDDKEFIQEVAKGVKIMIDYGRIQLTVKRIEKSDESVKILKEQYGYAHDEFLETLLEKKRMIFHNKEQQISSSSIEAHEEFKIFPSSDNIDDTKDIQLNGHEESSEKEYLKPDDVGQYQQINTQLTSTESSKQVQQEGGNQENCLEQNICLSKENSSTSPKQLQIGPYKKQQSQEMPLVQLSSQNKFAERLKQKKQGKRKIYDVIVCEVDSDCLLKSYKPIFIYNKNRVQQKENLAKYSTKIGETLIGEQVCEDDSKGAEEEEEFITPKDITDITCCLQNDIDCICISNVRSAKDINAIRNFIVDNSQTKIMAKIQTPEAIENFEEIVMASDVVQIARGYLTVFMPVEKLFIKQKEMIHKCHQLLKPVMISCNVLDSMVSSLLPTMCEVGEISNLVSDFVDGIALTTETSGGNHPIEAIQTLSRICVEAEALRIINRTQNHSNEVAASVRSSLNTIPNCIINCSLESAYQIHASIIVVFTTRGYTALKLSKLRPPCPVIAATSSQQVARYLSQVSAVTCLMFDNLNNTQKLIESIISKCKEKGIVKIGDFVVITCGDLQNKANNTNNLRIFSVE